MHAAAVRASSIAAWLGCGLTVRTVSQMLEHPRLAERLDGLLTGRVGQARPACPMQAALLDWDALALAAFTNRIGALLHARTIARIVAGPQVRTLVERIGPGLRLLALSHPPIAAGTSAVLPPEALEEAIPRDGLGALHGWCDAQPPAIGVRIALRLPRPDPAAPVPLPALALSLTEAAFAGLS